MKSLAIWVILGWLVGAAVNMGVVALASEWMPVSPPMTTANPDVWAEQLSALPIQYWLGPLLAHALGTLAGAAVAAAGVTCEYRRMSAMLIGCLFAVGGITMAWLIPAPRWLETLDLLLAYLPMAWLGERLARRLRSSRPAA